MPVVDCFFLKNFCKVLIFFRVFDGSVSFYKIKYFFFNMQHASLFNNNTLMYFEMCSVRTSKLITSKGLPKQFYKSSMLLNNYSNYKKNYLDTIFFAKTCLNVPEFFYDNRLQRTYYSRKFFYDYFKKRTGFQKIAMRSANFYLKTALWRHKQKYSTNCVKKLLVRNTASGYAPNTLFRNFLQITPKTLITGIAAKNFFKHISVSHNKQTAYNLKKLSMLLFNFKRLMVKLHVLQKQLLLKKLHSTKSSINSVLVKKFKSCGINSFCLKNRKFLNKNSKVASITSLRFKYRALLLRMHFVYKNYMRTKYVPAAINTILKNNILSTLTFYNTYFVPAKKISLKTVLFLHFKLFNAFNRQNFINFIKFPWDQKYFLEQLLQKSYTGQHQSSIFNNQRSNLQYIFNKQLGTYFRDAASLKKTFRLQKHFSNDNGLHVFCKKYSMLYKRTTKKNILFRAMKNQSAIVNVALNNRTSFLVQANEFFFNNNILKNNRNFVAKKIIWVGFYKKLHNVYFKNNDLISHLFYFFNKTPDVSFYTGTSTNLTLAYRRYLFRLTFFCSYGDYMLTLFLGRLQALATKTMLNLDLRSRTYKPVNTVKVVYRAAGLSKNDTVSVFGVFAAFYTDIRLKQIRFKPGYYRFFRRIRLDFKQSRSLKFKYQWKLTHYISKFSKMSNTVLIGTFDLALRHFLVRARFFTTQDTARNAILKGFVYILGVQCLQIDFQVQLNDIISIRGIYTAYHYIYCEWLRVFKQLWHYYWKFKQHSIYRNVFHETHGIFNQTNFLAESAFYSGSCDYKLKQLHAATLDVPSYSECCYISLTAFIVYTPYRPTDVSKLAYRAAAVWHIRMLNWKYLS